MTAQIVVGLGFGDEGKGVTTDYLCSQNPDSIVVRFSGGQQAGHTVMLDGIKHVHSNFCSGSLRDIPSYFSEHCCVYLNSIDNERYALSSKGIFPSLHIHPLAKLTTPYDVAFNKVTEERLRHGSCGMGIAATMKRHNETGYKLHAIDITYPSICVQKLFKIRDYYKKILNEADFYKLLSYAKNELSQFIGLIENKNFFINGYEILRNYNNVIFEGSQGIMLDMDHGVFPNVTYSNTTSKNAIKISHNIGVWPEVYYVTRCYQTRHGNGWMSNQMPVTLINNQHEINIKNQWQGDFRISEFDYEQINYALSIDNIYSSDLDKNLVVTCLDQRPGFELNNNAIDTKFENYYYCNSPESKSITNIYDFKSSTL